MEVMGTSAKSVVVLFIIISTMLQYLEIIAQNTKDDYSRTGSTGLSDIGGYGRDQVLCNLKCSIKCKQDLNVKPRCFGKCIKGCLGSEVPPGVYKCVSTCAAPTIARFHPSDVGSAEEAVEISSSISNCYKNCTNTVDDRSVKRSQLLA